MTAAVTDRFHIVGSDHPRPSADRVIFADGADAGRVRRDGDIELSHWVPNHTDPRYKADSSTEICLRYVADPDHVEAELVVNDHLDIDGVLALYALLYSDLALEHADTLIGAAEMGDFLAWAERPSFALAQQLSILFAETAAASPNGPSMDIGERYAQSFALVTRILEGSEPEAAPVASGWSVIERGLDQLGRSVAVERVTDRLVSYVYPRAAPAELETMVAVPVLNQIVDDAVWLWPQVRNRDDSERMQLVSVPTGDGWLHDLWMPGYGWAETPNRWKVPGLVSTGDSNVWIVEHDGLRDAMTRLAASETASGRWTAADQMTPFDTIAGRHFPVLASFVDHAGRPVPSDLAPAVVAQELAAAW